MKIVGFESLASATEKQLHDIAIRLRSSYKTLKALVADLQNERMRCTSQLRDDILVGPPFLASGNLSDIDICKREF